MDAWDLVQSSEFMTCLKYINHDLGRDRETVNTMWLYRGQVNFQSNWNGASGWHGSFVARSNGMLEITFNARGDEYPLRNTVLYPLFHELPQETSWGGTDYRARRITLTYLDSYRRSGDRWVRESRP